MARFTRRALLGSAAIVALGGVAYGGARLSCSVVPRNHPDFFSLLDITPDDAVARRIGERALVETSLPGAYGELADALSDRPLIAQAIVAACPTIRANLVKDQCALDFADGRAVVVDGWVLSETEAAFCAARTLRPSIA